MTAKQHLPVESPDRVIRELALAGRAAQRTLARMSDEAKALLWPKGGANT